jgi:hypothetical protein
MFLKESKCWKKISSEISHIQSVRSLELALVGISTTFRFIRRPRRAENNDLRMDASSFHFISSLYQVTNYTIREARSLFYCMSLFLVENVSVPFNWLLTASTGN